jgi:hypothetical protein
MHDMLEALSERGTQLTTIRAPASGSRQSDLAFARAEVSWDEVGSRCGFDNLPFESVVPEPATIALFVIGLAIIGFGRRKRTHWA